jgi:hypothetical protein
MRMLDAEDSDVPDNELIELALRDLGFEYIPKHAISVQKYYIRQPMDLYMGLNTSIQQLERSYFASFFEILFNNIIEIPSILWIQISWHISFFKLTSEYLDYIL